MTEVKGYLLGKVTQLISFTLSGHIFNPVHFLWTPMAYGTPGERFSLKAGQNFFGSKYWDRNASCLQHGQKKKRPIRNNSDIKYHFLKYPSWLRQRDQKEKKMISETLGILTNHEQWKLARETQKRGKAFSDDFLKARRCQSRECLGIDYTRTLKQKTWSSIAGKIVLGTKIYMATGRPV